MLKLILFILFVLAALIFIALEYGSYRWQAATKKMHARLEAAHRPMEKTTYRADALAGLPPPVQRYLRIALREGQPMIEAVSVEHLGTFNMSADAEQWKPFTSTQRVIARRPGFDWEARIEMMPGLKARVHDAYIAGEGILHASLFGLVTLVNLRGTPDLAQGELMRFLAESAWYPTMLLPGQGVRWEAVDDTSARATLQDGETTATLLFRFNEEGLIESVRAEARGRNVDGRIIPTPWEGRFWSYERRDGMYVPLEGEVAWLLYEGPQPYWRGRISKIGYEFTPQP